MTTKMQVEKMAALQSPDQSIHGLIGLFQNAATACWNPMSERKRT